jgi:hypothetical protein
MMTITIIRFLGLWLFSIMIYHLAISPNEYDETRQKVEDLVAAGEVDLEEVRPEFVRGILLLDMLLRTTLVSIFALAMWNILT